MNSLELVAGLDLYHNPITLEVISCYLHTHFMAHGYLHQQWVMPAKPLPLWSEWWKKKWQGQWVTIPLFRSALSVKPRFHA